MILKSTSLGSFPKLPLRLEIPRATQLREGAKCGQITFMTGDSPAQVHDGFSFGEHALSLNSELLGWFDPCSHHQSPLP